MLIKRFLSEWVVHKIENKTINCAKFFTVADIYLL